MFSYLSTDGLRTFSDFDDFVAQHKLHPPDYWNEKLADIKTDIRQWTVLKLKFRAMFKQKRALGMKLTDDFSDEREQIKRELVLLRDSIYLIESRIEGLERELVKLIVRGKI